MPKTTKEIKETSKRSTKKTLSKKSSNHNTKKTTSTKAVKTRKSKTTTSVQNSTVLEYYDLPYRYNQTIVKILAQTPSILFVYWDVSDIDRANFIKKYGDDFFNVTVPVLLIHNKTKNYFFEVEINDFANSWYLRMQEPDCQYEIELGRRNIKDSSQYTYISSSNQLVSPNDHVLFEKTDFTAIKFKNIKDGSTSMQNFGSIQLMGDIGKIYNKSHKVYRFYNDLYKDEVLESKTMFSNPSSSNPTSTMS